MGELSCYVVAADDIFLFSILVRYNASQLSFVSGKLTFDIVVGPPLVWLNDTKKTCHLAYSRQSDG